MTEIDRLLASLAGAQGSDVTNPALREAAVAVILAPDPARLLVIRRSERRGDPWSGHLALPGGRREPGDLDLLATAIRETEEETGLALERSQWRLTLGDIVPTNPALPPIVVRPFVFRLTDAPVPRTSPEVAHAAWIPLARFGEAGVRRTLEVESGGMPVAADGYQLDEGFLWGLTERILTPIVGRWAALTTIPVDIRGQ